MTQPPTQRRNLSWGWVVAGGLFVALCGVLFLAWGRIAGEGYRGRMGTKAAQHALGNQQMYWNDGDLQRFMEEYWKSDDLRFYSGGTVTTGWQATLDRYTKRYKAEGKEMGHLAFSDVDYVPLGPKSVMARGRWKVVTSKETFEGLFTLILREFPDGWKIVHDHTSVADKP